MRSLLVLALLGSAIAAGCLGGVDEAPGVSAGPTPTGFPVYGTDLPIRSLASIEPFETSTFDEVVLRGHVYLPDGEGPFATILEFSPYWSTTQGKSEEQAADVDGRRTMVDHFAKFLDAGFAVAVINIRGTGNSGGCNSWFDPAVDGPDSAAVINALSEKPWSNGNVGMIGLSWPGYTQYAALRDPPPALKAVAPSSGVPDAWTLFTRRGPPINTQFGPMAVFYGAALGVTAVGLEGVTSPEHGTCPGYAEQAEALHELNVNGDKTAFWQARDNRPFVAETSVPMFVTNGLTNGEGHILQFEGLWDLMPSEKRMLLGQWSHAYPDPEKAPLYDQQVVAWFDHYLRGGPKLLETGVVDYQDDQDGWHTSTRWPPASTGVTLFLSDGTLVTASESVRASEQRFVGQSVDPTPLDCAGTQALYVSPPLAEDVELAGNYLANVTLESTTPNGNIGVFLFHVGNVGGCPEKASGAAPTGGEIRRALSDLRHRGGGLEMGKDFPIGSSDVVRLSSHPFASVARAGERLVVAVSGGSDELTARPETPVLTVLTGAGVEATITIPVVSGTLRFE
jgi:uncharacterized protein